MLEVFQSHDFDDICQRYGRHGIPYTTIKHILKQVIFVLYRNDLLWTSFINNFLMNNEQRLRLIEGHSGLWPWQHMSRSRLSELLPLLLILTKNKLIVQVPMKILMNVLLDCWYRIFQKLWTNLIELIKVSIYNWPLRV